MTHFARRPLSTRRLARPDREAGAAMLIAVMVITVIAVIGTSVAVLASRTTKSAGAAQAAGVAKDFANAGIAEGVTICARSVSHLRSTRRRPCRTAVRMRDADGGRGASGVDEQQGGLGQRRSTGTEQDLN